MAVGERFEAGRMSSSCAPLPQGNDGSVRIWNGVAFVPRPLGTRLGKPDSGLVTTTPGVRLRSVPRKSVTVLAPRLVTTSESRLQSFGTSALPPLLKENCASPPRNGRLVTVKG